MIKEWYQDFRKQKYLNPDPGSALAGICLAVLIIGACLLVGPIRESDVIDAKTIIASFCVAHFAMLFASLGGYITEGLLLKSFRNEGFLFFSLFIPIGILGYYFWLSSYHPSVSKFDHWDQWTTLTFALITVSVPVLYGLWGRKIGARWFIRSIIIGYVWTVIVERVLGSLFGKQQCKR